MATSGKPSAISGGRVRTKKSEEKSGEKRKAGVMDLTFFVIVMLMLVLGIVMMFSASYAIAINETGDGFSYFRRQLVYGIGGTVIMLIISRIDYHVLKNSWIAYGLFGVSLFTLLLVPFIGTTYGGTNIRRGLSIGPINFQPSEVMKAAIIILFAYIISVNYKRMNQFKYGIVPFGIILVPVCGLLVLQPHYSCIILICCIGIVMMFVGGASFKHMLLIGLGGLTVVAGYIYYSMFFSDGGGSTFTNRIQAWLDPFNSPIDTWQTQQSLIAIGSGGIFGLGIGNSRQKYLYLPESHNDFIFSVICEELGFVGGMLVILLFISLIFRGFYIASKAPDKFGMMLVVGFTFQIGIQALFNIAVSTNAVPNTGISLPFFSYGGSALLMQLAEMGVILNISRQCTIET